MSTLGNEQNLSIRRAATPLDKSFYPRKQYHATIVVTSLCSFESISSVSVEKPWEFASHLSQPALPNVFASCHQSSAPAVFTNLSNRYDMFWLQIKSFTSFWRARTEKLAVLSSSAAICLYSHGSHWWAIWSCSGRFFHMRTPYFSCLVQTQTACTYFFRY